MNGDEEQAALVRAVRWPDDGCVPVEDIIIRARPRRARGWRILLQILRRQGGGGSWEVREGTIAKRRRACRERLSCPSRAVSSVVTW
jgi:hypothetical protein